MKPRLAILVFGLSCGLAGAARADAIDGHWCDAGTKHMEINGPSIVTPSGAAMTGDYDRHGFRYQEPNGPAIVMVLVNELTVRLKAGDGPDEIWHRCAKPVSQTRTIESGTGNG